MNERQFGKSLGSPVVLGCMRMAGMAKEDADKLIGKAMENGICSFDHADIYGGGESEKLFGQVLAERPELREGMFIQSKCGIRQGMYDLSEEYILNAVDGILERLRTDYLDLLILHRPDALMEPEEIAEAFDRLTESGKVRRFGVSNMNAGQIALLQNWIHTDLWVDQMQLSLAHSLLVDEGINVNMADKPGEVHTCGTLDYCRLHRIAVQCCSPLQYGFFEGTFLGSSRYPELNEVLEEIAGRYEVTKGAVAVAWLLRIPGVEQAIVGTTKEERVGELSKAAQIRLTREEWYRLYRSAGNRLP